MEQPLTPTPHFGIKLTCGSALIGYLVGTRHDSQQAECLSIAPTEQAATGYYHKPESLIGIIQKTFPSLNIEIYERAFAH